MSQNHPVGQCSKYRARVLAEAPRDVSASASVKKRVLLVDDDEQLLRLISTLLRPHFEVVGCVNTDAEAVEAVHALRPDVIVLDIALPRLASILTASSAGEKKLPAVVVFLMSMEDVQSIDQARATGARGFVFKGSIFRELPAAINDVLAGRTFISSIAQ